MQATTTDAPWRLVLDTVTDLVVLFRVGEPEPRCATVSASWLATMGGEQADWVGRQASSMLPSRSIAHLVAAASGRRTFDDVLAGCDGDVLLEVTLTDAPAGSDGDGSSHVLWVGRDIGEQRRAEDAMRRLNDELRRSNADLSAFASLASHDLQEPLRMITSYLQLLERRHAEHLDGDALRYLGFAVDGAQRLRTMIEALLEYTRIRSTAMKTAPTDLGDVLDAVRRELTGALDDADARLTVGDLPTVDVNRTLFQTLLQNLVGNALKFTGGSPQIHVDAVVEAGGVTLTVDDDGIGVPPERREEVFDLFRRLHGRTEYAGSGMGLALCRGIVEAHGGRITIEDSPMDGARARVSLPAPRKDTP